MTPSGAHAVILIHHDSTMPLSFAVWAPIPFLLVSQVVTFCIANFNTNVPYKSLLKAVIGSLAPRRAG